MLDIGCGAGYYGFLAKYSYYHTGSKKPFEELVGIDNSERTIQELLKSNIYHKLCQGSACSLPFEDNSFDTVLSIESLEHMYTDEIELAFKEMYRVAKDKIIISTPPSFAVSNYVWCSGEIKKIHEKVEFVSYEEYPEYLGTLHKSCIDLDVFREMGFQTYFTHSENKQIPSLIEGETYVYWANKKDIKLNYFRVSKGSKNPNVKKEDNKNYKQETIEALQRQIKLA